MKVNYFREMREHHMVITENEYVCPEYQVKMVRENEIPGLLRPKMRRVNGETEYDYSITGCQSLQTFVEGEPISGNVLGILVDKLCQLVEELERYLIDGEYLALRPEFIYLKKDREAVDDVEYCFFPFLARGLEEQLRELFKFITNEVDYQDKIAVDLAYELYQIVLQDPIDLSELRGVVQRLKKEQEQPAAQSEAELKLQPNIQLREEESCLPTISSEEILWMDTGMANQGVQKRVNRKSIEKREIALPVQRKKSILGLISHR